MKIFLILLTISVQCVVPVTREARRYSSRVGFLAPEKSFVFSLNCGSWNASKCQAAKDDLQSVGTLIGKELYFKDPVNVCAKLTNVPLPPESDISSHHIAKVNMTKFKSKSALI